ncbi:hypothetical protein [Clostridium niameyense]|uniref:hypothetical protein n=1 Tax=Clostridium niameyense TaxID=1622073 RepID=UPI00067F570E|nr:hypothetical protein [Clostridium niameyense]
MKLWKKYKPFIISFGMLFWIFAKFYRIKRWGNIIFLIAILLSKIDDVIDYAKKIGTKKFILLSIIFLATCTLTAFIFIEISRRFILSDIHKGIITIVGLTIDLLIMGYSTKKFASMS